MASDYTLNGMLAWLGMDDPTDTQLTLCSIAADDAENTIRKIRQQDSSEEIEDIYKGLAIEMSVYLYEKRGVDGVSSFSENGISRVYERGTFPNSMLRRITPKASNAAFEKEQLLYRAYSAGSFGYCRSRTDVFRRKGRVR